MQKRVVITGVGVISPTGIGGQEFWQNLARGISGIKEITLFDTSDLACKKGAEITDFNPKEILAGKKLHSFDRTTKLVCSAAKLALEDAGIELTESQKPRTGAVIGSSLGSLQSFSQFDRMALTDGFTGVSPADFPNTVPSVPVGQVSILFGLENFNGMLSTGKTSGLEAVNYGSVAIKAGRADVVLAGGVESLSLETYLQFYLTGALSGSRDGEPELCAPFDKRRNGITMGEGSGVVVLEEYEHAKARGANIYAEVLGYGSAFDARAHSGTDAGAGSAPKAMRLALKNAGLAAGSIDYLCANGNSSRAEDRTEAAAINSVFGDSARNLNVSAIKSMIAESFSAASSLQVCASALAIANRAIPPTINYREKDTDCDLPVMTEGRETAIKNALINCIDESGISSSLVISKL